MKISLDRNRSRTDTAGEEWNVCEDRAIKAMQTEAPRKDDLEGKKKRNGASVTCGTISEVYHL